jgi:hypothetical protein
MSPYCHVSVQNEDSGEKTGFESSSLSAMTSLVFNETSTKTISVTSQKPFQIFYSIFLPNDILVEKEKSEFVVHQSKKKAYKGNLENTLMLNRLWV